jgi:general secretion pathway protein D
MMASQYRSNMQNSNFRLVIALAAALLLSACTGMDPKVSEGDSLVTRYVAATAEAADATPVEEPVTAAGADGDDTGVQTEILNGSGSFIDADAARRNIWRPDGTEGDIVLNFEESDIRDVAKTILGDMLNANYTVDPAVTGTVTLSTSRPMSAESLLPTLEVLLGMNGAALTKTNGIYAVIPAARAPGSGLSPQLGLTSSRGYQLLVVPLEYISVTQMQAILEPLLPESSFMNVDKARNLLLIGGARVELQQAQATVNVFDVDQMRGMSIGLFRLDNADADEIRNELEAILGANDDGPLADMLQMVTISRLNALVVMSKQDTYLEEVRGWIKRLDRADESAGLNMYVYPVQNGRAENLAQLLSDLFTTGDSGGFQGSTLGSGARSPSPVSGGAAGAGAAQLPRTNNADSPTSGAGEVRIIADQENNALVIMATRTDYARILAAVRRLDVMPLQVLVEATILEVTLTDELSYGLQWFFKNSLSDFYQGGGELLPLTVDPSFSYTVTGWDGDVRAVLNLLAADAKLDVVSSPSLMVLDNRTATIKVGDQVPIRTSETTSLASSGNDPLVTSTIQYRDTGVVLEVTPRVNPGGMVMLEITQDVNDVDNTTTSSIDSPTIIQRRISTSVAVKSGESVVLGGLIRENESVSDSGVPGLRRIPVLGRLFSSRTTSTTRTELLVLITPTAISNVNEAREATLEMKNKLAGIDFGS